MKLTEKKKQLECKIRDLINKFNSENEIKVSSIDVVNTKSMLVSGEMYCREVKVGIEI